MWKRVNENTLSSLEQGRSYIAAIWYGYDELVAEEVSVDSIGWLHKEGVEHFDESQVLFYMDMPAPPDIPHCV